MQDFCKWVVLGCFLFVVCCLMIFVKVMCLKAFVCAGYSGSTKRQFMIKNGAKRDRLREGRGRFGTIISGSNPDGRTKQLYILVIFANNIAFLKYPNLQKTDKLESVKYFYKA